MDMKPQPYVTAQTDTSIDLINKGISKGMFFPLTYPNTSNSCDVHFHVYQ